MHTATQLFSTTSAIDLSLKCRVLIQLRKNWAELFCFKYDADDRDAQLVRDERRQVQARLRSRGIKLGCVALRRVGAVVTSLEHKHMMVVQVGTVRMVRVPTTTIVSGRTAWMSRIVI